MTKPKNRGPAAQPAPEAVAAADTAAAPKGLKRAEAQRVHHVDPEAAKRAAAHHTAGVSLPSTTTETAHGPNLADRSDTVDEHHTDAIPRAFNEPERTVNPVESMERAVPRSRRIDEGQNLDGGAR
jgi:hypothetical protein